MSSGAWGQSIECRVRPWPGGPTTTLRQIKTALDQMPRTSVVQLAWGEMLKKDQTRALTMPVLHYLSGTDARPRVRGYFKTVGTMMTYGTAPAAAVAKWPVRPKSTRVKFSLSELCELYRKADGP